MGASSSGERIKSIDGFRALAMAMVFLFHIWEFSGAPSLLLAVGGWQVDVFGLLRGNTRVDLFVVLSGFCLFLPLVKNAELLANWNFQSYARRRLRRIVPAYYAALLYAALLPLVLVGLMKMLHREASWQEWPSWQQWASHLLFVQNFWTLTWDGINGSLWTMSLEMQFYVSFPFVVWGFRRFGVRVIGFMLAASVLYRVLLGVFAANQPQEVRFLLSVFFLGRWMEFALGLWACWFVMECHRSNRSWSAAFGTGAVLVAIAVHVFAVSDLCQLLSQFFPLREVALGTAFALAIGAVCVSKTPFRALVENKVAAGIGFISYSVFLIHQPTAWYFSEFCKKLLHIHEGVLLFCVLATAGFALVLLLGFVFFLICERPFLQVKTPDARRRTAVRSRAMNEPLLLWKIE